MRPSSYPSRQAASPWLFEELAAPTSSHPHKSDAIAARLAVVWLGPTDGQGDGFPEQMAQFRTLSHE